MRTEPAGAEPIFPGLFDLAQTCAHSLTYVVMAASGKDRDNLRLRVCRRPAASITEIQMGDLVNLKKLKKRAAREQLEQQAAANRARFGRTRLERARDEARASRAENLLDQHRIDSGDAT